MRMRGDPIPAGIRVTHPTDTFRVSFVSDQIIDDFLQAAIKVTMMAAEPVTDKEQLDALTDAYAALTQRKREVYERIQYLERPHNIKSPTVLRRF